jgi:hypothetical protein
MTSGVGWLHDTVRHHAAGRTRALLDQFEWEIFEHPPYSPQRCTTRLSFVSPPQEIFDKIKRQITLLQDSLKSFMATLLRRRNTKAG